MLKKQNNSLKVVFTLIKYLFPMILPCMVWKRTGTLGYPVLALFEIGVIALVSQLLCRKSEKAARILSGILLFTLNMQYAVLYFGNSFLSFAMVDNMDSFQDISGKFYIYIPVVLAVIGISFLPERKWEMPGGLVRTKRGTHSVVPVGILIVVLLIAVPVTGFFWKSGTIEQRSPYYALIKLAKQVHEVDSKRAEIRNLTKGSEDVAAMSTLDGLTDKQLEELSTNEFFRTSVEDHLAKPEILPEQPNVILIFTEGLSQTFVEDERNLMPNLAKLESEGLFFERYYNHTFATYLGLSGQLYSGYQQGNTDKNVLISLQDVMAQQGYHTTWINTEPKNREFSQYLEDFGFQEMLTSETLRGSVESISDRDAYAMLYDVAMEKDQEEEPFFLCIYTFGTHVNQDSPDEVYEDGHNMTLNRVTNLDIWLGEFLEKFQDSPLAEDTLLIFTADHAAYKDADYSDAFPLDKRHDACDEVPLVFYYKGMTPEVVDAAGRNSINITPTILDYLDVSEPNFFLGDSLFAPLDAEGSPQGYYDTIFYSSGNALSTRNGTYNALSEEEMEELNAHLMEYFRFKLVGLSE